MYAIIDTQGEQIKVEPGQEIKLNKFDQEKGSDINFDKVLCFKDDDGNLSIGTPILENVTVKGKLVTNGKDKKIEVLKFKKRKRYKVKTGHRQLYSKVKIEEIIVK